MARAALMTDNPRAPRKVALARPAFLLLWLVLYTILGSPQNPLHEAANLGFRHAGSITGLVHAGVYLGVALFCSFAVFLLVFASGGRLFALIVLAWACHVFDVCYAAVSGGIFSLSDYLTLTHELAHTETVLREYVPVVAPKLLIGLLAFPAIAFGRRLFRPRLPAARICLALALALAACTGVLYASEGKRDAFVSAVRLPALALYAHIFPEQSGLNIPYAPRDLDPAITPVREPAARHILLLIDESVTSQYLSINGYPLDTTPFLARTASSFINFGHAASVSNLSMNTNYILRNGVMPGELPDREYTTLTRPSLFTYAKRAGMRTVLIDAQQSVPALQNCLSNLDMRDIDDYLYYTPTGPRHANDFLAVDSIRHILSRHEKAFIMVVKYGAHFPYRDRCPDDRRRFAAGAAPDEADLRATPEGRKWYVNTYLDAIYWNVDVFFEALLAAINPEDTVILYTSDHGQSVLDPDLQGSHGTKGAVPEAQISVPLLGFGRPFLQRFAREPERGLYAQGQIFPTLLQLFGYADSVANAHGPSLFEGPGKQLSFSGALFGEGAAHARDPSRARVALPDGNFAAPLAPPAEKLE